MIIGSLQSFVLSRKSWSQWMILQALSSGFMLSDLCFIWLNKYLMELREYTDKTLYRGNYWCAYQGAIGIT